jgi:hypothetical protein
MVPPTTDQELAPPDGLGLVPVRAPTAAAATRSTITVPLRNDVILGRGVPIRTYRDAYMATGRQHIKQQVFLQVMDELRERNCRFLVCVEPEAVEGQPPDPQAWCEATAEAAETKVKQALRERDSDGSPKSAREQHSPSKRSSRSRSGKPKPASVTQGSLPLPVASVSLQTGAPPLACAVHSESLHSVLPVPPLVVPAHSSVTEGPVPTNGLDVLWQAAATTRDAPLPVLPPRLLSDSERLASTTEFCHALTHAAVPTAAVQLASPPVNIHQWLTNPSDYASAIELFVLRQTMSQAEAPVAAMQLAHGPVTLPLFSANAGGFASARTAPFAGRQAMLDPSWLSTAPFQPSFLLSLPQVSSGHAMPLGVRGADVPLTTLHVAGSVETLELQRQAMLRQVDEFYIRQLRLNLLQQQQR